MGLGGWGWGLGVGGWGGWVGGWGGRRARHLPSGSPVVDVMVEVKDGDLHIGDRDLLAIVISLKSELESDGGLFTVSVSPCQVDLAKGGYAVLCPQVIGPRPLVRCGGLDPQVDGDAYRARHAQGIGNAGNVSEDCARATKAHGEVGPSPSGLCVLRANSPIACEQSSVFIRPSHPGTCHAGNCDGETASSWSPEPCPPRLLCSKVAPAPQSTPDVSAGHPL